MLIQEYEFRWLTFAVLCITYLVILEVLVLGLVVFVIAPVLFVSSPYTYQSKLNTNTVTLEHFLDMYWSASSAESTHDKT